MLNVYEGSKNEPPKIENLVFLFPYGFVAHSLTFPPILFNSLYDPSELSTGLVWIEL